MPGILSAESLPNIQGNILTPFKRAPPYVFACFGDDAQRSRDWLAEIVAVSGVASRRSTWTKSPDRYGWPLASRSRASWRFTRNSRTS